MRKRFCGDKLLLQNKRHTSLKGGGWTLNRGTLSNLPLHFSSLIAIPEKGGYFCVQMQKSTAFHIRKLVMLN